jgi:preprotein translocase subunit SecY
MWNRICSIWTVTDLRNKILFTLVMLLIYRLLASISVPLTAAQQLKLTQLFASNGDNGLGQLLGLLDAFSGGSLQTFSIAALGVYPYITATIVMQLLGQIIPALRDMQKDGGEEGKRKFSQITRLIAVPLALLQAFSQLAIFVNAQVLNASDINLFSANWLNVLTLLLTLAAGTMILVWFGELITEYGLGNGTSLIIFAGIVSTLPVWIKQFIVTTAAAGNTSGIVSIVLFVVVGILTMVGMVYLYQGQRRIAVQYPTKRQVGRGMVIGSSQTTYIPMQVNSAGMVPLIFANSLLLFPTLISRYLSTSAVTWLASGAQWVVTYLANTTLWSYWLAYFVLVVAFTYMYAYMQWEQQNIPETLQKQGAYVSSYRPGEPTRKYLLTILSRLTLAGALCLGLAAVLPFLVQVGGVQLLSTTKVLITVGVVLDTMRQFDAQMVMRNYKGFLA